MGSARGTRAQTGRTRQPDGAGSGQCPRYDGGTGSAQSKAAETWPERNHGANRRSAVRDRRSAKQARRDSITSRRAAGKIGRTAGSPGRETGKARRAARRTGPSAGRTGGKGHRPDERTPRRGDQEWYGEIGRGDREGRDSVVITARALE